MTDQEWLDYVYSLIGQASSKFWTPAEILLYKKVAIIETTSNFFNLLAVTHKKIVKCAMTADDPYITFPAITTTVDQDSTIPTKVLYVASTTGFTAGGIVMIGEGTIRQEVRTIGSVQAGASLTMTENLEYTHTLAQADAVTLLRESQKIIRVEYTSTGGKLDYIEDDQLFEYDQVSTGTPQVWMFEDNKVRQVPTPATTEADYWRVFYLPRFTLLSQLPEELHPLIAINAVISAKGKDERMLQAFLLKREQFYQSAITALSVAQLQEPDKIRSFDSDEEYD